MIRSGILWLSEQQQVFRFVRSNGMARRFASRFVAGETVDTAIEASGELNKHGITATLDLLGESVSREQDAAQARQIYLQLLERIAQTGVQANASVKLTQMGFDIGEDVCLANMSAILARAKTLGSFVRIDMESSAYTQRTLEVFYRDLYPAYGPHVGVVIQSCLRRSEADVEALIEARARVRLCKGAYRESPEVAFPAKQDVDRAYIRLMERLMERGNYPGLATHDERMLTHAREFARAKGIDRSRFEFQMLYGVRRDLQQELRAAGYNVRVYVPFGTQWYPYLMRRLAERPANIAFILGNVLREAVHRRT
jgi:proline dehydrogenase